MKNKINIFINIVMGTFGGFFIGYCIYTVIDYKNHPYFYSAKLLCQSVVTYGAVSLAVITVCAVIKYFLKR